MATESEPARMLLPYLQRADELQKCEPLVAYYCRLYAMDKGLRIPPKEKTKTTNSILNSLINQLEKDKKTLKLSPDDYLYLEGFASNIFSKADKKDRAGRADKDTAKTFYAAFIFFDILNQFGDVQPDIEQKMKYAVWKAADISKALKEGRRPEPGPPGGDQDDLLVSPTATSTHDVQSNANFSNDSADFYRSSSLVDKDLQPSTNFGNGRSATDSISPHVDKAVLQPPTSPPSYHVYDSPSADERKQDSYQRQSYPTEQLPRNFSHAQNYQSDMSPPQNYYPHEPPSQSYTTHEASPSIYSSHDTAPQISSSQEGSVPVYSYPNFQTYPSFNDTSLPTAPAHFASHYQVDATPQHPSFSTSGYTPEVQHTTGINPYHVTTPSPPPPPPPAAPAFTYDCNYQPSVEKIAEAHKAARFAVGALAFDDVPVAVDFLRRSLELLTNPSAESR